jgi:surfeit locus 1 family protein
LTPLPVDTIGIPNDHLEYAITWFLLAVVWLSMSLYWVIRTLRRKESGA